LSNSIVAIDVGTSKITVLIGELTFDNELRIIGNGVYLSYGIKRGMIVDIEACVRSISAALAEAQKTSAYEIHSAFISISGSHLIGHNSVGVAAIQESEVSKSDLSRVLESAQEKVIHANQRILHVLPQEYVIDEQDDIREPLGMSGVRLEVKAHVITCAANAAQNLEKCMRQCNLTVDEIVVSPLASAIATLKDDEKNLGVCLIDIGGGTTDIVIFTQGAVKHTAIIPIAGDHITNDIAVALRTTTSNAEDIKIRYACSLVSLVDSKDTVFVHGLNERPGLELSRNNLAAVVEHRYSEIFSMVYDEIRRSGFIEDIGAGIVLTGGTAKMEGTLELAEEIFQMPVRIGIPSSVRGIDSIIKNPIYSTAVGLLQYGAKNQDFIEEIIEEDEEQRPKSSLWDKVVDFFSTNYGEQR